LDADAIGGEVGWAASALSDDEVYDAANYLFTEGYVTGMPVKGLGIPRPILTPVGHRVAKTGNPLRSNADAREAKSRRRPPSFAEASVTTAGTTK
jgi:hypothetical protein